MVRDQSVQRVIHKPESLCREIVLHSCFPGPYAPIKRLPEGGNVKRQCKECSLLLMAHTLLMILV